MTPEEQNISIIRWRYLALFIPSLLITQLLAADPVPVHRTQGTFHGFLAVRTLDGKTIASGDLIQVGHGDRVTARLTLHFRDGSLDDETAVYSQRKVIQLISDRHIQRGPAFPNPLDMSINAATGQIDYRDKDGKTVHDHIELPSDICNGLFLPVLLNVDPPDLPIRLSMIVPAPKPRLIHLAISSDGEDPLAIGGVRKTANKYRFKFELGGITGIIAPIIGRQPSDIQMWIMSGDAPAFVRGEGQFYEGGPIWRIELIAPVFPHAS